MTEKVEAPETPEQTDAEAQTPALNETEQKASDFGWQSKDKWVEAGNKEEDWVPAKQFLYIGDLKQQVIGKDKELSKTKKMMNLMKDHHLQVRETAYKDAVAALKAEKAAALEEGDMIRVEKIKDRMDDEKAAFEKDKASLPKEVPVVQTPPPEFYEFQARNPWYQENESKKDDMSREADALGDAMVRKAISSGKQVDVKDIYKEVETKIRKMYPEKFGSPKSPQTDSPKNTAPSSSKSGPKLTEDELAVAKAFNLSPEDYAKEQKGYKGR